jgi:hypothetical protein
MFWNLNRRDLRGPVARLAERHHVQILVLAESVIPHDDMLSALNASTSGQSPGEKLPG